MEQLQSDMMGYDRAITLFSPDGRLLQVEYARKTVSQGSAAIGLVGKNCVVLAADNRLPETEKLIVPDSVEKIFKINSYIAAAMSGMIADGRVLIEKSQLEAQQHMITYNEPADILLLIKSISTEMQAFTQYGGARPYGVSILYGGFKADKPVLYMLEPSGIFFQYNAVAIGENSTEINKYLEGNYQLNSDKDTLIKLAIKAFKASGIKLSPSRFDIVVVDKSGFSRMSLKEIESYL